VKIRADGPSSRCQVPRRVDGAMKPKAIVSWSTGKDSAFALQRVREQGQLEVVGMLTTLTAKFGRVSMHGVRESLLDAQARALRLPCHKVLLPFPCPNAVYEQRISEALKMARARGVTHVVFGDLFLEDIRAYREAQLAPLGLEGVFPIWKEDTGLLAREMVHKQLAAILTCVDPAKLDGSFAGSHFDLQLIERLPPAVDPCGENGEFHTFAYSGPMFRESIPVAVGPKVERDGFVFADLFPTEKALSSE
jgi:uncharacterized protein (TIGR00290 family)